MPGLSTYSQSNKPTSQLVGYAIRQAGTAGFLTNANVAAALTLQALIDDVNAAVVAPGAEAPAQRLSIVKALQEGGNLGDLSTARILTVTTLAGLENLTWVSDDAASGHLGPSLIG